MRHPGLRLRGHSDALVAANLDLGATLADLAGIGLPTDGRSLVGPLFEGRDDFREQVPIQGWPSERPVWAGVLSGRWKYVVHGDGQEELYDLDEDPYELRSRHADPDLTAVKADLRLATEETRGPAIVTHRLPPALVGAPYAVDLEAWGRGSLSWSARGATLPEGLALSEHGRLEGAPTETGRFSLLVRVEEDSRSPWTGQPRSHVADLVLDVREPCGCASRGGLGALGLPLGGLLALLRRRIRGARGASGK
jgi:hypothetical protein